MHNTDMRNSVPGTFYHYLKTTVLWDVRACNFVCMNRQISLPEVRGSVSAYLPDSEGSHLNKTGNERTNLTLKRVRVTNAIMIKYRS
jgi:hypothetical protein